MSKQQTLDEIEQALKTMGVTDEWALEHMRISALEEKQSCKDKYQPKAAKYKLFLDLTGTKPVENISQFYSTVDKLLDAKIILLGDALSKK
jgi:hypothetical protein